MIIIIRNVIQTHG